MWTPRLRQSGPDIADGGGPVVYVAKHGHIRFHDWRGDIKWINLEDEIVGGGGGDGG